MSGLPSRVDQRENVGNGSRIIIDYPGRLAGLSLLSACPLRATSSDSEPLVAGRKAGKREAAEVALLFVRRELWSGKAALSVWQRIDVRSYFWSHTQSLGARSVAPPLQGSP